MQNPKFSKSGIENVRISLLGDYLKFGLTPWTGNIGCQSFVPDTNELDVSLF